MSVLQNVILPKIAVGCGKKERTKKAMELLEHFGVKIQADKLPNELSGGQQQRVAICRSLVNDPDILLADEPVGNLDSHAAEKVMELLKDLNEKQKKTVILVTHNPAYLNAAHRVFYMKDGYVMNVKVNKAVNEKVAQLVAGESKPTISKDLELLIRTYSSLSSNQIGTMLIPFKAKQIVSEVLVGMTTENVERIEKEVENLLTIGINDNNETARFFDMDVSKGGMGMDKRTAENIDKKVKDIIREIKILQKDERKYQDESALIEDGQIIQLRQYLFDLFEVQIDDSKILSIIDMAIKARIESKIDKKAFQNKLDLPVKKHGAGLDRRVARKIARRLELLMLGKFK